MNSSTNPTRQGVADLPSGSASADSLIPRKWKFVSLLRQRWFRVSLLVLVCVFEVFLTYFLKRMGWLGAIDWGTQILVVAIILSPLLLAGLVIAGRNFRLSSMMIALTLIGVFLGFVMIPVNQEIRARTATQKFSDTGVQFGNQFGYMSMQRFMETGEYKLQSIERLPVAPWIDRVTNNDLSMFRDREVGNVQLTSGQLESVKSAIHYCENLDSFWLLGRWSENSFKDLAEAMNATHAKSLIIGDNRTRYDMPLKSLGKIESLENLALVGVKNGLEAFVNWNQKSVRHLSVDGMKSWGLEQWRAFCESENTGRLTSLTLHDAIGNQEAAMLESLDSLKSLCLSKPNSGKISDLKFISNMPSLKFLQLNRAVSGEDWLGHLESAKQLEKIYIFNCPEATIEKIEALRVALPNCEIITNVEQ